MTAIRQPHDPEQAVEVARRYAQAYAAFDVPALLDILAPHLRFRQANPGGYLELDSAQEYVEVTREFLDTFDHRQPDHTDAEPLGDLAATSSRMLLRRGDQDYVMQHWRSSRPPAR